MIDSRSDSSSVEKARTRLGDRQVHVVGNPAALDADCAALRLQPLALARRADPQRAIRLHLFLQRPGRLVVAAAQVRHDAFEVAAKRLRRTLLLSTLFASSGGARPEEQQVALLLRQLAERRRPGRCRTCADSVASASATSFLSPRAHGAIAPAASDFEGSGTMRAGSKSQVAPRPWQSGHAPCGELNENARGVISGTLMPQLTHASRRENSRSPSSRLLMTTMSSASWSAVSTDSVSRRSMPERTISRSTTTSIVWFFRRSSLMSSSSERNWPSMRALVKPRVAERFELLLELALAAADDRRQHVDALVLRVRHHHVDDALERLRRRSRVRSSGSAARRCSRTAAGGSRRSR